MQRTKAFGNVSDLPLSGLAEAQQPAPGQKTLVMNSLDGWAQHAN
jgi:hypothetical protein